MNRKMMYALFAVVIAGAMLPSAHADTVSVTLTPSTEMGVAGEIVTYSATLAAPSSNGAAVFLNDETIDLNDPSGVTTDGTDLFLNFPFDLNPGDSASGDLFTVTLPSIVSPGSYSGDFVLQGGSDLSAENTLATVPFTLVVAGPVPEPSTWVMVASGVLGIVGLGWRRRATQL
jgi:PEP-CTERM motif